MTAALTLLALSTAAADLELRAGPERVSLLELYTSEGCSSCPPADRWLSGLREDPRLWREVVPVAFHVDYWDRLGWPDRFGDAAHTARQHAHAHAQGMRTVYTPGLFLDGEEWRRWAAPGELRLERGARAGELHARVAGDVVLLSYRRTASDPPALDAHVALLGFGLRTEVRRGENAGRALQHDFVVLAHASAPLSAAGAGPGAALPLAKPAESAERLAIAVWVSRRGLPAPLQAAGGWLPAPR